MVRTFFGFSLGTVCLCVCGHWVLWPRNISVGPAPFLVAQKTTTSHLDSARAVAECREWGRVFLPLCCRRRRHGTVPPHKHTHKKCSNGHCLVVFWTVLHRPTWASLLAPFGWVNRVETASSLSTVCEPASVQQIGKSFFRSVLSQ